MDEAKNPINYHSRQVPTYYPGTEISPAIFYSLKWANEDNTYEPVDVTDNTESEDPATIDPSMEKFVLEKKSVLICYITLLHYHCHCYHCHYFYDYYYY